MARTTLVVYGDFNCPYCYALSEVLLNAGFDADVQWRTVQHLPNARCDSFTPKEQSLLSAEVYNVRHRVPTLNIAIPPCRPNTALANQLLLIVSQQAPAKTEQLKQLIFRTLWVDGEDISSTRILLELLPKIGFDGHINAKELGENSSLLQAWQWAWQDQKFESQLPVIVSGQRYLLGLALEEDIQCFIRGEEVSGESGLSCFDQPLLNIAILGELTTLWHFVEMLRHQYHIHLLESEAALQNQIKTDSLPDLILIDADVLAYHGLSLCEALRNEDQTRTIPIMLIASEIDDETEISAYRLGVSDFMRRDRCPEVFKARVDMLLQLKVVRDELDRAARLDGLTQIYNRREFDRMLLKEWRRCARSRTMLSLLMVDIDRFKNYNDEYGHLAGDGCLRMLAQAMKNTVERTSDLVCRYGGEEFAVLLPDTSAEGAQKVARNIQHSINELAIVHAASDVAGQVTISIGCSTLSPDTEDDMLKLIVLADQRLYLAKERGRNCIVGKSAND